MSFETLRSWPHHSNLKAPELLLRKDGEATKRFFRLPKGEVDLEWAREGQCWEKLPFLASDGVACVDLSKLQNRWQGAFSKHKTAPRLGMAVDFLIRWTQPAGAGEIAWLSTGWEAPQVSLELVQGGAEVRFAAKAILYIVHKENRFNSTLYI